MASWQTVRVFISSTFRDMHAERDFLVKYVFPDLREWCERWKLHLVDIDLRWGVTAAEAESGKVIDICLEQIDGSRPFFICMLGNRYGHVPKPGDVPQTTRERYDRIQGKEDYSITHLEIHHAILESLKSLDALEQTPHAFFYFRDEHSLPGPEDIRGFDREQRELYKTIFFEEDAGKKARLHDLKGKIKRHYERLGKERNNPAEIFERIFTYKPEFDPNIPNPEDDEFRKGRITRKSLKEFGERVKEDLKKAISRQFSDRIVALSGKVEEDALETERDYHESFVEHRIRSFIGRAGHLKELTDYVEGDSTRILAVYGEAGSGKSALLAKFYRDYKYDKDGNEINKDVLSIPHFIGASPGSSALHNLLRRLCEELFNHSLKNEMEQRLAGVTGVGEDAQKQRDAIRKEYEISSDINKLPETFKSFLAKVKGKTIILIDGLNQLDETERAHDLNWLPNELAKNAKIIVSTLEGDTKEALEKKTDKRVVISPLTDVERLKIIREMPSVFCKTLDDEHIKALLEKKETANPLYLKMALEELRIYGGFGKKGERLKELIQKFPTDVVDMFVYILDRLERDVREGAKEGDKLCILERLFCLLECSQYGLTSGELRELMADDAENLYQGILRQIRDYLLNRGELIDFFHRELSKAIRKKYLRDGDASRWHRILAEYFHTKPLYLETEDKKVPNTRKLVEQPWQQTKQGNMWDELEKTLTDLYFIEAKCISRMLFDLIRDFDRAIELRPLPSFSQMKQAIYQSLFCLNERPELAMQSIYNRLMWFEHIEKILGEQLEKARLKLDEKPFWIKAEAPIPGSQTKSTFSVPFGITSSIQSLSLNSNLIAVASFDGNVEIRNISTGELVISRRIGCARIKGIALDGDLIQLSYMDDQGIIKTEHSKNIFPGRKGETFFTQYSQKEIIAVREDNALVLWQPECNATTVLVNDLPSPLIVLRVTQDKKKLLYVAGEKNQRIGVVVQTKDIWIEKEILYDGHIILDADLDSEGKLVLLGTMDRQLRILDIDTNKLLVQLYYERDKDVILRGTLAKCRFGVAESRKWIYFTTHEGDMGHWRWQDDTLIKLVNYKSKHELSNIFYFEVIPPSEHLFFTTERYCKTITKEFYHEPYKFHAAPVSGCAITHTRQIVSISEIDKTIRWYTTNGLNPLDCQAQYDITPTVITRRGNTDDVIIGSKEGWVWNQPRNVKVEDKFKAFAEPVVSIFSKDNQNVISACKSCCILNINLFTDKVDDLSQGTIFENQLKILPSNNKSLFWSVKHVTKKDGTDTVVCLVHYVQNEEAFFSTKEIIFDVDASDDGNTLCVAGKSVQILHRSQKGLSAVSKRRTTAKHVAFLLEGDFIAVVLIENHWLEVWSVAGELSTVAAIELPGEATCISTLYDQIVIGFRSGFLMSLRLCKTKFNEETI